MVPCTSKYHLFKSFPQSTICDILVDDNYTFEKTWMNDRGATVWYVLKDAIDCTQKMC